MMLHQHKVMLNSTAMAAAFAGSALTEGTRCPSVYDNVVFFGRDSAILMQA